MSAEDVLVPGWPPPKGYSNGRVGSGRMLHVGGQIGWNAEGVFATGFVAQFAQTLDNVIAVVKAAGWCSTTTTSSTTSKLGPRS